MIWLVVDSLFEAAFTFVVQKLPLTHVKNFAFGFGKRTPALHS